MESNGRFGARMESDVFTHVSRMESDEVMVLFLVRDHIANPSRPTSRGHPRTNRSFKGWVQGLHNHG